MATKTYHVARIETTGPTTEGSSRIAGIATMGDGKRIPFRVDWDLSSCYRERYHVDDYLTLWTPAVRDYANCRIGSLILYKSPKRQAAIADALGLEDRHEEARQALLGLARPFYLELAIDLASPQKAG